MRKITETFSVVSRSQFSGS